MKICLITLGCAKNLVDSEMILGVFKHNNDEIVTDPYLANLIIVNTCGFIEPAKVEAINTICEMIQVKEVTRCKLIVVGCLAERYKNELVKEFTEVDRFIAIAEYSNFSNIVASVVNKSVCGMLDHKDRLLSTPKHWSYLKIADGCDNCCTYCAIPLIRKSFRSRSIESIIEEVKILVNKGSKEINLISQDTSRYGTDFKNGTSLVTLLKELDKVEGIYSIRILYLYPDEISDELIDYIASNSKVAPYFDIPVQHGNDEILKSMNRRGNRQLLLNLIKKIRNRIPYAVLRTSIIVGFPGEGEKEFKDLISFIKIARFDRLGAFKYSPEEDTKSFDFANQVEEEVKNRRYDDLMLVQQKISYEQNNRFVGKELDVIVERYDRKNKKHVCRSYGQAPDDIDGYIYISATDLIIGDIYRCKIVKADYYNLEGELI